jgi:hypothetical protein
MVLSYLVVISSPEFQLEPEFPGIFPDSAGISSRQRPEPEPESGENNCAASIHYLFFSPSTRI